MYAEKGIRLDEAMELLEMALALEPDNGYFVDSLGWIYYQKGMYDEALKELERAVLLAEDDPIIYDHLGDVYLKKGSIDKAVEAWEKSLEVDPEQEKVRKKIEEVKSSKTRREK